LDAWSDGLLRTAQYISPEQIAAADMVRDTWDTVIHTIEAFDAQSSLKVWVYRILTGIVAQRGGIRIPALVEQSRPAVDPSRFQGSDEPFEGHWREFPTQWPPVSDWVSEQIHSLVATALTRLPDRHQLVVTLRDIEGFDPDEITSIVAVSAAEQRTLLHRARSFIRQELEASFTVVADQAEPVRHQDRHIALRRRLLPLYVAAGLQGVGLWVPVEKLFQYQIGFTPATIGIVAAAYAAFTPAVELPSGVLADRWSRRGVLVIASSALTVSALVGGLSTNVATYAISALILGIYFAMYSGTMESIIYDTVLEETGDSGAFQRILGRVRLLESVALVSSSLVGGWLADMVSARSTYFLTVPFVAASIVLYLAFREPKLHKAGETVSLRNQVVVTYRTLTTRGAVLPIAMAAVLTSLVMQVMFEFGPLWLVALSAAAFLYGPFWAALVSTLGLGGLLAGKIRLDRWGPLIVVVAVMMLASATLTISHDLAVVTVAQVVLTLLVVVASIYVTGQLHDAVPSSIRSGVASGIGAISWIVFLPVAFVFGLISNSSGVHTAAWLIVAAVGLTGLTLVRLVFRARPHHGLAELFLGYVDGSLTAANEQTVVTHLLGCEACRAYVDQLRQTIAALGQLPTARLPDEARDALLASLRSRTSRARVIPRETTDIPEF
jgi:RNA polymerase sigma factor (sigma-70 family)